MLQSALVTQEATLVKRCMEVIDFHAKTVLSQATFVRIVTEATLCHILGSPSLRIAEVELYDIVVQWEGVLRDIGLQGGQTKSLAAVVRKPIQYIRLALLPPEVNDSNCHTQSITKFRDYGLV